MKIVAVLYTTPPYRWVGGEAYTLRVMRHLADLGHQVKVVAAAAAAAYTWDGLDVVPCQTPTPVAQRALRDADVIVTHPEIGHIPEYHAGGLTSHRVWIVHNTARRTLRSMARLPQPQDVVTVSKATADVLYEQTGHRPLVLYPPTTGCPEVFRRVFTTQVGLSPPKGGPLFDAVAAALPWHRFLAVAGGYDTQSLPVRPNVTVLSHGPSYIPLALTRVLMSPSRSETYGMLVAEACQSGVPVVASDLPAHREVLGESFRLLPVDDVTPWVHEVDRLDEEYAYAEAALQAAERGRVLDRRTQNTLDAWQALLGGL